MIYWVYLGLTFLATIMVCRALLFPRSPSSWGMNLVALGLPIALPYRLVEKWLLDSGGGLFWAFLSGSSVAVTEFAALFFFVYLGTKKTTTSVSFETILARSFFLGLHFGWGKACRDSLLLFVHLLAFYYGYSQFTTFPSLFFLLSKTMEVFFEAQIASLLGIATFFPGLKPILLFFTALILKVIPNFLQTAIQFVPPLRFFASLYFVSFLPLLLIAGFILLFRFRYRTREKP